MAKLNLSLSAPKMEAIEASLRNVLKIAKKYPFSIVEARLTNSRIDYNGKPKKRLPDYVDQTEEILLVLEDMVSKGQHTHRMALNAFMKFDEFSKEDVRDNGILQDKRDNYALIKDKKGALHRIPAQIGHKDYDSVQGIFSRFIASIGLPVGTTPEDCDTFVGLNFEGELEENKYQTKDDKGNDIDRERLKLKPWFKPITEDQLEAIKELAETAQTWS
jgi:hypothetical protein